MICLFTFFNDSQEVIPLNFIEFMEHFYISKIKNLNMRLESKSIKRV